MVHKSYQDGIYSKFILNFANNIRNLIFNKNILKMVVYAGLRTLNRSIPKRSNQILFASTPDFSDNPRAFYDYLNSNSFDSKYEMVWITQDEKIAIQLNQKGIRAYSQKGLQWIICFFRSRYIIVSHGNYGGIKSSNQVFVELWHGMPLKAMGFVDNRETNITLSDLKINSNATDILIATSKSLKNALISCFYIDPRNTYVTGQPRNDKLFSKNSRDVLNNLIKKDISHYKKIVLYTPTFRMWTEKHRTEGKPRNNNIFGFDDYSAQKFQEFIKENKILFLFKLHPFEEDSLLSNYMPHDNIVLIKSEFLQENSVDLYDILGGIDILITDYSSIYFDYLLLNRPIIFITSDLEAYENSRGFVLEPYNFWAPGPKANTFQGFLLKLNKCIDEPEYYQSERTIVNNLINFYQDDNSCMRVLKLIETFERKNH